MMSHRLVMIAALAALLAAPCAAQDPAARDAAVPERPPALDERQSEFFGALAAGDADAVAALFTQDAVVHVADMPAIEGRDAIRRFYGNLFGFLVATRSTPEAVRVSADGEMAYSVGRTVNEFRGRDGPVEYAGKYLLVWRREAGEWRIAAYSVSSDAPPESEARDGGGGYE